MKDLWRRQVMRIYNGLRKTNPKAPNSALMQEAYDTVEILYKQAYMI